MGGKKKESERGREEKKARKMRQGMKDKTRLDNAVFYMDLKIPKCYKL